MIYRQSFLAADADFLSFFLVSSFVRILSCVRVQKECQRVLEPPFIEDEHVECLKIYSNIHYVNALLYPYKRGVGKQFKRKIILLFMAISISSTHSYIVIPRYHVLSGTDYELYSRRSADLDIMIALV
jgi:hypothetical protein